MQPETQTSLLLVGLAVAVLLLIFLDATGILGAIGDLAFGQKSPAPPPAAPPVAAPGDPGPIGAAIIGLCQAAKTLDEHVKSEGDRRGLTAHVDSLIAGRAEVARANYARIVPPAPPAPPGAPPNA